MIIVSQDKTDLINFDNISWLYIEPNDFTINIALKYGDSISIAKYKTQERAKEVLQEIVQAIVDNRKLEDAKDLFGYSIIPSNTLYVMPKE